MRQVCRAEVVLRGFCSEHPAEYPVKQRGVGSSLELGCSLACFSQQKGKIGIEIRGETCLRGERSHKSPAALRSFLSSPGKAQMGPWVSRVSTALWEKGKVTHGVCVDSQSPGFLEEVVLRPRAVFSR